MPQQWYFVYSQMFWEDFYQIFNSPIFKKFIIFIMLQNKLFPISQVCSFIEKIGQIVQDVQGQRIIKWNDSGDSIIIDCHNQHIQSFLRKYFNHDKISSLIRQLNIYGFKKIVQKGSQMTYQHPYFVREKSGLRKLIKRKRKVLVDQSKQGETQKFIYFGLKEQAFQVQKLQNILYSVQKQNKKLIEQKQIIQNRLRILRSIKTNNFLVQWKKDRILLQGSFKKLFWNDVAERSLKILKGQSIYPDLFFLQQNFTKDCQKSNSGNSNYNCQFLLNTVGNEVNDSIPMLKPNLSYLQCQNMNEWDHQNSQIFLGQNNQKSNQKN